MSDLRQRLLCLSVLVALVAPVAAAGAGGAVTLRSIVEDRIAAEGFDPAFVLAQPAESRTYRADGAVETDVTTLGDALREVGRLTVSTAGAGVLGTPETSVGDQFHLYVNLVFGTDARAYRVSQSTLAPTLPSVTTPEADVHRGGPLSTVSSSAYSVGYHLVGDAAGRNADTSAQGPYLSKVNSDFVIDTSIDFVGHAEVVETHFCSYGTCIAIGTLVGTGVAVFSEPDFDFPQAP